MAFHKVLQSKKYFFIPSVTFFNTSVLLSSPQTNNLVYGIRQMKKINLLAGPVLLGIAVLAMTSCSSVPQEKIDAANLGINDAKAAGAGLYATSSFNALQDSLSAAMENIEVQNSKFFKSYKEAEAMLDGVISYSAIVKTETEANKEALKAEIAVLIADIRSLIEENNQLTTQAPKGKEGTAAIMAIKGEISTLETVATESETLLNAGDLIAAKEKTSAAKEKATAINTELKDVIAKYSAAKR